MAAFVFIAGSITEEIVRIASVFICTGCSVRECRQFLMNERRNRLFQRYMREYNVIENDCSNKHLVNVSNEAVDNISDINNPVVITSQYNRSPVKEKSRKPISDWDTWWSTNMTDFEFVDEVYEEQWEEMSPIMAIGAALIKDANLVYSSTFDSKITPGTSFYITGCILRNCERFSINLACGLQQQDLALHINPRLPQNYIVRNCKIKNIWGTEEVTSTVPFSLKRGHPFTIQVLVTESEFFIAINDVHFASFVHRIPYHRITALQIKGDVTDIIVEQSQILEYPDRLLKENKTNRLEIIDDPSKLQAIHIEENFDKDEFNSEQSESPEKEAQTSQENTVNQLIELSNKWLVMPFNGKLPRNLQIGDRIHIIGRVKVLPHSFFLNLQQTDRVWPHPIIAFHLNPRFANVGGKHIICCNSWFDKKWDREERSEVYTDFMPSRRFHLVVECNTDSFVVYLNNKLIAEYRYRKDLNIVDTIYLQGDIKLKTIALEAADSN